MSGLGSHKQFFAMDASSGYVVHCAASELKHSEKNPSQPSLRILDLCCCPGGKLQQTCSVLGEGSIVVGVDASERRMDLCKALFRKKRSHLYFEGHHEPRVLLFHADGTSFGTRQEGLLVFDSDISIDMEEVSGTRKRRNKSYRKRERKLLKMMDCSVFSKDGSSGDKSDNNSALPDSDGFDVVFVDAECSHDGSFRHMSECEKSTIRHRSENGSDVGYSKPGAMERYASHKASSLPMLQRELILNGFSMLKPGGTLVYSTCSLSPSQNEHIVQHLLENERYSKLVEVATDKLEETSSVTDGTKRISTPIDAKALLSCNDTELLDFFSSNEYQNSNSEELADSMCRHVSALVNAPCFNSTILPGSVVFNRRSGTSGLFVSKIKKLR